MKTFFRKWRKENLNSIGKYLLYALGEIILIIIGILIAVNINDRQTTKKDNILRCQYLEELNFSISHDIKDVKENIGLFEERNPKIKELLIAIENKKLLAVDSLFDKINTLNKYVLFVQQSKSKIEELKYSNVNLIQNRPLKNRLLFYQESKIMPLLNQEKRFDRAHEKVREYFESKFDEISANDLESDKHFFWVANQKYNVSEAIKANYEHILKEQYELQELIELELAEKCNIEK